MGAETYELMSVIFYIFTGLCFITAIVLFFAFKIPKAVGYVYSYGRLNNNGKVRKKHKTKSAETDNMAAANTSANNFREMTAEKSSNYKNTNIGTMVEESSNYKNMGIGTTVEESWNFENMNGGTTVEEADGTYLNESGFRIIENVVIVHTDERI